MEYIKFSTFRKDYLYKFLVQIFGLYIFRKLKHVDKNVSKLRPLCQIIYNGVLPIIGKEFQMVPIGVYSLNVMKDTDNRIIHSRLTLHYITSELSLLIRSIYVMLLFLS